MKGLISVLSNLLIIVLSLELIFPLGAVSQGGFEQQPLREFEDPGEYYGEEDYRAPGVGTASRPLRGRVVVAPAGSRFDVTLATTLSSGINRVGDIVNATVSSPLAVGADLVIPAGSLIVGQVVNAIPARRFKAGSGGILEIRFTSIETPDGQRFPLSAQIDTRQFNLQAETAGSRVAKGVGKTAVGAGLGAALGTALGAIAGGKQGVGKGAWSGAAIGGGVGALSALASKGKELELQAGTTIPIELDQSLQVVVPQGN